VAIFSYDGGLNFGVTGDYDTAEDLDVLTAGIEDGLAELLELAGEAKPKPKPKTKRPAPAREPGRSA